MAIEVITKYGLATTRIWDPETPGAYLMFEDHRELMDKELVFRLSDHVIIRLVKLPRRVTMSNLAFRPNETVAKDHLSFPTPVTETTFHINLRSEKVEFNRPFEDPAKRFLWITPRVDDWARGSVKYFELRAMALRKFEEQKMLATGLDGISASVLLDLKKCRVLWFYLSAKSPDGVLWEKKFEKGFF